MRILIKTKIMKNLFYTFITALILISCGNNTNESKLLIKEINNSYTPCECADISYKVLKIGGVENASTTDVTALNICNKEFENAVFMSKVKNCESYKKMINHWK